MNFLDFLLLFIVGFSVLAGFRAGFARVTIGFAATIIGIFCGFWFYRIPGSLLEEYLRSPAASNLLGFFIVFAVVVVSGGLLARLLSTVFKWVGLSWLDRLLGAAFGLVRGAILAVAVVTVITAFAPSPPPAFIVRSKVMPDVGTAGNVFAALSPRELKDSYHKSLAKLRETWDNVKSDAKQEKLKKESY